MDFTKPATAPPAVEDDDSWDADGFEIPSLETSRSPSHASLPPPAPARINRARGDKLYLGPCGAPPSQSRQQSHDTGPAGTKQRLKHKLRDAEKKSAAAAAAPGRENKVEVLRALMGSFTSNSGLPTGRDSSQDWLEPYCQESQFERRP